MTMRRATISRIYQSDCTVGIINFGDLRAYTLELPWQNNEEGSSCIPAGTYLAKYRLSPSNGDVIELQNVVGRTYIQIHSGNYTSQIKGCILIGDSLRDINTDGVPDVTNSKQTLSALLRWAGKFDFILVIK